MTQSDSLVGKTLGPYEILAELGRGSMSVVYRTNDKSLARIIALKVLPQHIGQDADFDKRFLLEARAIAQLNHPNIAQIFSADEVDGRHCLAMELVEGSSVKVLIREKGRLDPALALEITRQAALALAAGHALGIIHRNIKPQNVLISETRRVKVVGFGLAKSTQAPPGATAAGMAPGASLYMSPEQVRGGQVDGRSDLFSLGIVLYEMLSGMLPYDAFSPMSVMSQIVQQPLPSVDARVPQDVSRILKMMAAKNVQERFPSAAALVTAIDAELPKMASGKAAAGGPGAAVAGQTAQEAPRRCPACGRPAAGDAATCDRCGCALALRRVELRSDAVPATPFQQASPAGGTSSPGPAPAGPAPAEIKQPGRRDSWLRPWGYIGLVLGLFLVWFIPKYLLKGSSAKQPLLPPPPAVSSAEPRSEPPPQAKAVANLSALHGGWFGPYRAGESGLFYFQPDGAVILDDVQSKTPIMTGVFKALRSPEGTDTLQVAVSAEVPSSEPSGASEAAGAARMSWEHAFRLAEVSTNSLSLLDQNQEWALKRLPDSHGLLPGPLIVEANLGSGESQFGLGQAYAQGEGLPKSDDLAMKWYGKAAAQGHPKARHRLGLLLPGRQDSTGEDRAKAYELLYLAAAQGETVLRKDLEALVKLMTPYEFSRAKSDAANAVHELVDEPATIVGRWRSRQTPWSYDFRGDGTAVMTNPQLSDRPIQGTYSVSGKKLTILGDFQMSDPKTGGLTKISLKYALADVQVSRWEFTHAVRGAMKYAYRRVQ